MTNDPKPNYDLIERTAKFGEDSIRFAGKIPKGPVTNPLITQYIKYSTSIGAETFTAGATTTSQSPYRISNLSDFVDYGIHMPDHCQLLDTWEQRDMAARRSECRKTHPDLDDTRTHCQQHLYPARGALAQG